MSIRRLCLITLATGGLLTEFPPGASGQSSASSGPAAVDIQQASIDLPGISAYVDVRDQKGRAVESLKADIFVFVANGRELGVDKLERPVQAEGLACALLVDVSGSVRGSFPAVQSAVAAWLGKLSSKDRVALVPVGSQIVAPIFSIANDSLQNQIRSLSTSDQRTLLFGAILRALDTFRTAKNLPARRAIVIVSDGVDEDDISGTTSEDVKNAVRDYGVPIYMLGVASTSTANVNLAIKPLTEVVRLSHGLYRPLNDGKPAEILDEFLDRIRNVYHAKAECELCSSDGQKHELGVKVGKIKSESLLIAFVSTHPLYTRLWFQLLLVAVGLLIALAVWLVVRWRKRLKGQRLAEEERRKRKEEEDQGRRREEEEARRKREEEERRKTEEETRRKSEEEERRKRQEDERRKKEEEERRWREAAPWKARIGVLGGANLYDDVFYDRIRLNDIPGLHDYLKSGTDWEIRSLDGMFELVIVEAGTQTSACKLTDNSDFHAGPLTLRFYVESNQAG